MIIHHFGMRCNQRVQPHRASPEIHSVLFLQFSNNNTVNRGDGLNLPQTILALEVKVEARDLQLDLKNW